MRFAKQFIVIGKYYRSTNVRFYLSFGCFEITFFGMKTFKLLWTSLHSVKYVNHSSFIPLNLQCYITPRQDVM